MHCDCAGHTGRTLAKLPQTMNSTREDIPQPFCKSDMLNCIMAGQPCVYEPACPPTHRQSSQLIMALTIDKPSWAIEFPSALHPANKHPQLSGSFWARAQGEQVKCCKQSYGAGTTIHCTCSTTVLKLPVSKFVGQSGNCPSNNQFPWFPVPTTPLSCSPNKTSQGSTSWLPQDRLKPLGGNEPPLGLSLPWGSQKVEP